MDELFAKYERELVLLRSLCREYAQRYPKVAAQLQLGGEACDDPHVERLIQAVALLCARVSKRLDDNYPQFTEALLNLLFPHYLRPFPSCAIVRVGGPGVANGAVPRGTRLETRAVKGVPCTFTTAYDVPAATIVLTAARFAATVDAPPSLRLPAGASAVLSLQFTSINGRPLAGSHSKLRLYIDGDPAFCASLRDALFVDTRAAYLQCAEGEPWLALAALPHSPVGFAEDEALIPFGARSHLAYRVLAEYFAFPDKFNFLDIDLGPAIARAGAEATRLTLHLVLTGVRPDSDRARLLSNLSPEHLLQGCTPVVNLFAQSGVPITFDQRAADYTVLAHPTHPQAFEVVAIDHVHMVHQHGRAADLCEFLPFYSLRHGEQAGREGRYWLMRRDDTLAICSPGHETILTLIDAHWDALAVDHSVLSLALSCSSGGQPIRFLRRPTRPLRLVGGPDTQWRLISHLALNHHSLVQDSAALRETLSLYDLAQSPVARRQISAITAVEAVDSTAWVRHQRGSSLVHGTEVRVTVDQDAFIGNGLHLFAQVLEQFFGLAAHLNSFVELVILSSHDGKELLRCTPRSGSLSLV